MQLIINHIKLISSFHEGMTFSFKKFLFSQRGIFLASEKLQGDYHPVNYFIMV